MTWVVQLFWSALRAAKRQLLFLEERANRDANGFGRVPQRHDRWIPLTYFQSTQVAPINTHSGGNFGLRKAGCYATPLQVSSDQIPHILWHSTSPD
jgi:hypothetical protein